MSGDTNPVSFQVKLASGTIARCHQDQIRCREGEESTSVTAHPDDDFPAPVPPHPGVVDLEDVGPSATLDPSATSEQTDTDRVEPPPRYHTILLLRGENWWQMEF